MRPLWLAWLLSGVGAFTVGHWLSWLFPATRRRRACFHHDHNPPDTGAVSWIKSQLIDMGSRKMYWCTKCEKTWFL